MIIPQVDVAANPKVESYKFSWLEEFPINDWSL